LRRGIAHCKFERHRIARRIRFCAHLDRRPNLLHLGRVDLLAANVLPRLLTQDDPAALVVVAARLAVAVAAAAARL